MFLHSTNFCLFLLSPPPRVPLLQPRKLLLVTQLTSWGWTLTLNPLPRPQPPPLHLIKGSREEWKLHPATVTSLMTCSLPLVVRQDQCRKTCSSVGQPVRLHQTQNVRVEVYYVLAVLLLLFKKGFQSYLRHFFTASVFQPRATCLIRLGWGLALVLAPVWVRLGRPLDRTCLETCWVLIVQPPVGSVQLTVTPLLLPIRASSTSVSTLVTVTSLKIMSQKFLCCLTTVTS